MNDTPRPRRSPTVVLLDAMLNVVTRVQATSLPGSTRTLGRTPPSRRTVALWLIGGVLVVAGGTIILIGMLIRAPGGLTDLPLPGKAAPPPPAPVAAASSAPSATTSAPSSAPARTTSPTPSAAVSAAGRPSASALPPAQVPPTEAASVLNADYVAANGSGLLGYRATVTLTAGGAPSSDWRLSITLPRSTLQIGGVRGATAEKDGAVWTLTPVDDTRTVQPGTPVVITFDVRGATLVDAQPTDCRVNDQVCGGLPG